MPYSLTEWSIGLDGGDGYRAPEICERVLHGHCPERGRSGPYIRTSPVDDYDPVTRIATTRSGSQYRLDGEPAAEYAAWCRENGHDYTRLFQPARPRQGEGK